MEEKMNTQSNIPPFEIDKSVSLEVGREVDLGGRTERIITKTGPYITTLIRTAPDRLSKIYYQVSQNNNRYHFNPFNSVPILSSHATYSALVKILGEKA